MRKKRKAIVCSYQNQTSSFQIIRLRHHPERSFERTLFPGQRFQFKAVLGAKLEIGSHHNTAAVVCDRIPCRVLIQSEAT